MPLAVSLEKSILLFFNFSWNSVDMFGGKFLVSWPIISEILALDYDHKSFDNV